MWLRYSLIVLILTTTCTHAQVPRTVSAITRRPSLVPSSIIEPIRPHTPWIRTSVRVARCQQAPHIDGVLDDSCWKTATHARAFYRCGGTSPISEETEAWMCADSTHLYFAFHCIEHHPELIRERETQRDSDGVFQDDYINIDIDSQTSRRNLTSFYITPRGVQNQILEGGTADNIIWAGDWQAATKKTPDGWNCEVSIPFALLRYTKGSHSFAIGLFRKLARETSAESWPYLPRAGWINGYNAEAQYLNDFIGISPPFYPSRPIFLPYFLASGGSGNSFHAGMDIKYPLSTTLTGVVSILPDFQTIEQDVTNIDFSYTEKLLTDRRPFFAEGADYFPNQDLFYSRRLSQIDGGLKIAGKQGRETLGFLATGEPGSNYQSAIVFNASEDFDLLSSFGVNYVSNNQVGAPNNQVARLGGVYGWQARGTQYTLSASHAPSWLNHRQMDSTDLFQFATRPEPGHLRYTLAWEDIGPNFISDLGYVPESDIKGGAITVQQGNRFDSGRMEAYGVGMTVASYSHHTAGFFHNDASPFVTVTSHAGERIQLSYDVSRREQFRDHTSNVLLGWGEKSLYHHGYVSSSFGTQAGSAYTFWSLSQGFSLSSPIYAQLDYNRLSLGNSLTRQSVVTGSYRLTTTQSVGTRVVAQDNQTDVYLSYGQHVRSGNDVFVLFGDPNSPRTRGEVTVKVVRPF